MIDVSELVGMLRGPIKHPQQSVSLRLEAADALETLEREVNDLETELEYVKKQREDYFSEYRKKLTEYLEMKISLAEMALVVEAARQLNERVALEDPAAWTQARRNLETAIATLEAAHD